MRLAVSQCFTYMLGWSLPNRANDVMELIHMPFDVGISHVTDLFALPLLANAHPDCTTEPGEQLSDGMQLRSEA